MDDKTPAANKPKRSTAAPKPAAAPAVTVTVDTVAGFTPPPKPVKGNNGVRYPFDSLEVGGYFFVTGKTLKQMVAPVRRANKSYLVQAKDASGKVVKETQEREFYVAEIGADQAKALKGTPHENATIVVVRST